MSDIQTVPPDPRMVKMVYWLYLLSLFFGPLMLAGLAMAHDQKRNNDQWINSHYRFQIRTGWLNMLFALVIALPAFAVLGAAALGMAAPSGLVLTLCGAAIGGVFLWWIMRCVRGLRLAFQESPIPNPKSWLFGG